MKQLEKQIDFNYFDRKLIKIMEEKKTSIGLATGKMGACIYFYILSRSNNNEYYQSVAGSFMDDIFNQIQLIKSPDISQGILGIGLGINYLIKNKYLLGDINNILREVDDYLFTEFSYTDNLKWSTTSNFIQILIYFNIRLKDQKKGSEQEYLYKEFIIHIINILYGKIKLTFFDEPHEYTISYELPLLLYALSETYKYGFYNQRLDQVINELSIKIFSIIPTLNANKLYLLWGINRLFEVINKEQWQAYMFFLSGTLKTDCIVMDELRDRNIFFVNGLTSMYLLAEDLKDVLPDREITVFKEKIQNKILHSQVWDFFKKDEYFINYLGLSNGYCGVSLLLQLNK